MRRLDYKRRPQMSAAHEQQRGVYSKSLISKGRLFEGAYVPMQLLTTTWIEQLHWHFKLSFGFKIKIRVAIIY